jgi:hypothetical protein
MVMIRGTDALQPGNTGRIYLHTSAGIRRFDIPSLPTPNPPTQSDLIAAIAQCERRSKMFSPLEEIGWLVDPPPFDLGFPALRQWLFTFAELPAGTRIAIHRSRDGVRSGDPTIYQAERAGEASLELLTDRDQQLVFEHNQDVLENGRVSQRWIVPLEMIDLGEAGESLTRAGGLIVVVNRSGILAYNLSSRSIARRMGVLQLQRLPNGTLAVIEQRQLMLDGDFTPEVVMRISNRDLPRNPVPPFSLSLPHGKVAALYGNQLVIGIPWQSGGVIRT